MSDRIVALARRVEDDPSFLAASLSTYARAEGLTSDQLAKRLGCTPSQLSYLSLCRMPRSSSKDFQQDVERIAAAFHIDVVVLAEMVRLAVSLQALGQVHGGGGFLMAARDRSTSKPSNEPEEGGRS